VARFGAFSAFNAFIIGALFLPALDSIAGAVEGGNMKVSSFSLIIFFIFSAASASSVSFSSASSSSAFSSSSSLISD
jgi:hypothetical protein